MYRHIFGADIVCRRIGILMAFQHRQNGTALTGVACGHQHRPCDDVVVQAITRSDRELLNVQGVVGELVPSGSMFAFLADRQRRPHPPRRGLGPGLTAGAAAALDRDLGHAQSDIGGKNDHVVDQSGPTYCNRVSLSGLEQERSWKSGPHRQLHPRHSRVLTGSNRRVGNPSICDQHAETGEDAAAT